MATMAAMLIGAPVARADDGYPFRDPGLPLQARINDLVGRLTLEEKVGLLHQYQPAIPRLGIDAFKTGTEALHGVAWLGPATVFPQALGLATTWNPDLVKRVGSAVGQEARGFNAIDPAANSLNVWAPVVNLLRDPRWGRNEEGYAEDPYLTGLVSTAYGNGLAGDHPTYLQTAPTLKHYLAYNNEAGRDVTDAIIPPKILNDYDRAAFRPAIASGAATGVMPGYNLVNGRPSTVSPDLNEVIRSWTTDDLMMVSDAWAPYNLTGSQRYYATQAEADAAAIRAGLDSFTQDNANPGPMTTAVMAALDQDLLTVADIETANRHLLAIRFRLGEFDPPGLNPYAAITADVINAPDHQRLARQAAAEQLVLLKNDGDLLPLKAADTGSIAVVGPLSASVFSDFYSGTLPYTVTPLDGITQRLPATARVTAAEGCDRIALKEVSTGRYVTAGTGAAGAALAATAENAGTEQRFDVNDWGQGVLTLRAAANGRYVTLGDGRTLINNQTQPNGWFVEQLFALEAQSDGTSVLRFTGYDAAESWFGPNVYVTVDEAGTLSLGAASPATAARFTTDLLSDGLDAAVAAAREAEVAVVVVGSHPMIGAKETIDRQTTALAADQETLVQAVRAANPNTVVVVESSYPQTIGWAQEHVPSILWSTHAGQETGNALAEVLFGDHTPAGRLTQTWYRSDAELPDILDYDIAKTGMTYLYHQGTPLYPFGYGLSYTTFRATRPRLSTSTVDAEGSVTVSVDVTNTGSRAGTEVVQLYTHQRRSRASGQPVKQLRAFARVTLAPGELQTVQLQLQASDLAFWDVTRSRPVVESGVYDVLLGSSAASTPLSLPLRVRGETIPPRELKGPTTQAVTFDDYSGVRLVDATRTAGTAVAATGPGQWIKFGNAALRGPLRTVTATVARDGSEPASIEIRLDHPTTGRLLGSIPVPATGDRRTWTEVGARLHPAAGRHDVYLVFTGPAALNTFSLG
ncbi:MAG: carbohydrate-binding protein [Dactylosporangium sp.]|nr:glycoside hydrolase family 3 C-terminal domain-containing protein [Dactylosporangium sp.]NNJ62689.1 carbohydrate-binding protein [Dactylosporangium sp.]